VTAVRLLFDEDADHRILRGLRRVAPKIDACSVMDVGLAGRPDREILTWAATEGRLLVTRDVHAMTAEHAAFVQGGQGSAGVVFIPHDVPIGRAIAGLILICEASTAADWGNRTDFLPL
jgi:hypothetical protein